MSKVRIKYQNLSKNQEIKKDDTFVFYDSKPETEDEEEPEEMENFFRHDPTVFLLNNLLMTVQFFRNYDREVEVLRENWFKENLLESHHKKCFHADSLFRLTAENIKFIPRHGINKNNESLLHPLRIFISSDNLEAAYDPSILVRVKKEIRPRYMLAVHGCKKKKQDSGFIFLTEFKTLEPPGDNSKSRASTEDTRDESLYAGRDSEFETGNSRRLTRTEKFIAFQSKEVSKKILERRASVRFVSMNREDVIPANDFYNYVPVETAMKPRPLRSCRMNVLLKTSHEIPRQCFQILEIKNDSRRGGIRKNISDDCITTKILLNSEAFKGYFCDLLIQRLAEPLQIEMGAEGSVLEESVVVKEKGIETHITPVIEIKDWRDHVDIMKKPRKAGNVKKLEWPTSQMRKIMEILPCYAVPVGYSHCFQENLDYEKEWKLIFPKSEEYLLLHMMKAHIRCYFFALAIYKSFIEPGTSAASIGPKHLRHLLFWMVHRNFIAWPEDRPGETLLHFFKTLYKKLQNKTLPDFFIPSRNLFGGSLQKDLHKAQFIIKMFLDNPLPYVTRALRDLHIKTEFNQVFDFSKFNAILTETKTPPRKKQVETRKEKKKQVRFEDDQEKQWKINAFKQIQLEKKIDEEEELKKLSIDSISTEQILRLNPQDNERCQKILDMFISHFTEMGIDRIERKCLPEALMYLNQIQGLMELLVRSDANQEDSTRNRQTIKEKIDRLKEKCNELNRTGVTNPVKKLKPLKKPEVPKKVIKLKMDDESLEPEEIETKL